MRNATRVSRLVLLAFIVSCAGSTVAAAGQKFFGCCYTPQSNPVYEAKFKDLFTMVVPENAGKWDDVEDTRGVFTWSDFDEMAAMAASGNKGTYVCMGFRAGTAALAWRYYKFRFCKGDSPRLDESFAHPLSPGPTG